MSFDEWRTCACELDELERNNMWKEKFELDEYDPILMYEHIKQLEDVCISCDVPHTLFLI